MDFSMRFWKKFSLTVWLLVLLLPGMAEIAAAEGIDVRNTELVMIDDTWQLNADFDINFSTEVEAALNKGVALNFVVEFELVEPHRYWFDDEVASASQRIRLSYHALSRQYLINAGSHQKSFATMQEAKEDLEKLRNWPVLEKSQVKKSETPYYAILRMRLDHARLPKALQVDTLGSETWNLVSERHRWVPALTNTEQPASPIAK
jgi:hypothetical protein